MPRLRPSDDRRTTPTRASRSLDQRLPAHRAPEGQERLEGADASHAWLSVFLPGHGWIDVDPTNRITCGDQHIKIAYGRDYFDVSMLKGAVTGGGEQTLSVEVTVRPIG